MSGLSIFEARGYCGAERAGHAEQALGSVEHLVVGLSAVDLLQQYLRALAETIDSCRKVRLLHHLARYAEVDVLTKRFVSLRVDEHGGVHRDITRVRDECSAPAP